MKRLLLFIIIFPFLMVGCQFVQTDQEPNPSLYPDRETNNSNTSATESVSPDTTLAQEESNLPAEPNAPVSDISTLSLSPPIDWFYTQNAVNTLSAVIYTNHNPDQMRLDKNLTHIPDDFAVGALVLSPLPEESDPDAMKAGLKSNLESYGAQEMEGMLYIANQIGLLDITGVESVEFILAQVDVLGEHEALFLDGNINLQGSDQLHAHIWLTWTQTSFVSLFEFAKIEIWPSVEGDFSGTRATIVLH